MALVIALKRARRADIAIVTNDNPRGERPESIAAAVAEGAGTGGMSELDGAFGDERGFVVELDRARAIEAAILSARGGDVVLIAGKGHETYQIVGAEKRTFDDRIHARRALSMRRARKTQA